MSPKILESTKESAPRVLKDSGIGPRRAPQLVIHTEPATDADRFDRLLDALLAELVRRELAQGERTDGTG